MHSLKNTVVAVLLLGVSYGVYEVITTPDPTVNKDPDAVAQLDPAINGSQLDPSAPFSPEQAPFQTQPTFQSNGDFNGVANANANPNMLAPTQPTTQPPQFRPPSDFQPPLDSDTKSTEAGHSMVSPKSSASSSLTSPNNPKH